MQSATTRAATAQHTPQRVTFQSPAGHTLVGLHTLPEASHAVILQHGYTSSKDGFHLARIAQGLAQGGVGSIRFDFGGNGESEGPFKFANYSDEIGEMEAAAEFLRDKGQEVFGVLGHSKGGTEVILYGAKHDSDRLSIVNVCGRFHLLEGLDARFSPETREELMRRGSLQMTHPRTGAPSTLTQEDMNERLTTDMEAAAKAIQQARVLTLHGTADDTIPVSDASEFDHRVKNHTLRVVEGADHGFSQEEHAAEAVRLATEFFLDGQPSRTKRLTAQK